MRSVSAHPGCPNPVASAVRRRKFWFALAFLVAAVTLQAQQALRIFPLVRDERVLVTFELTDGFSEDVRAAILSGLKTTFTYTVDLRLDVPVWADRSIGSSVVTTSVEYDNLTRRHTIVRMIDGRVEQSQVTDDQAVVRQWMTSFKQLPLFRTTLLLPNRDYYVRVSAVARPTNGSILWPWGSGTSAQAKFTFIR
ncbi:MAG TPA: DUF4390 domain-containing protein [Vicinamibacterales bacterium]